MFQGVFEKLGPCVHKAKGQATPDAPPVVILGLMSGTRVATRQGWRPVEAISEGDEVLTFDDGLQRVTRIRVTHLTPCQRKHLPLFVPVNALGNRTPLWLMPDQLIVIESDSAETLAGDAFAAIPAAALDGLLGIERAVPTSEIHVVTLFFDEEQIIYTNAGVMLQCPSAVDLVGDIFHARERRYYARVPAPVAVRIARAVALEYGHTPPDLPAWVVAA